MYALVRNSMTPLSLPVLARPNWEPLPDDFGIFCYGVLLPLEIGESVFTMQAAYHDNTTCHELAASLSKSATEEFPPEAEWAMGGIAATTCVSSPGGKCCTYGSRAPLWCCSCPTVSFSLRLYT